MTAVKRIVKAFIVGGCAGFVGQALMAVVSGFVADPIMVVLVSMLLFGFIGAVLICTGIYTRIAWFGGDGAGILLCGLMYGAASVSAEMRGSGAPNAKAILAGFGKIMVVLGSGFVVALIIGILVH